ncbi:MAG TPA: hypothetical protein VM263_08190 [Acidimicrobiales bacterium]|nr:hypothetical protein [Acidimicrobiales bacterium]
MVAGPPAGSAGAGRTRSRHGTLDTTPAGRRAADATILAPWIATPRWSPATQASGSSASPTSTRQRAGHSRARSRLGATTGPPSRYWRERTGTTAMTAGPPGRPCTAMPRSSHTRARSRPCASHRRGATSAGSPHSSRHARRASGEVTAMATTHTPGRRPRRAGTTTDSSR